MRRSFSGFLTVRGNSSVLPFPSPSMGKGQDGGASPHLSPPPQGVRRLPRAQSFKGPTLAPPFKGVFVTGTDTGVGKTIVAAAIALALRSRGMRIGVMKPVESGCPRSNGALVPHDALLLKAAAGCEAALDLINPYALEHPLAPALAAELEGVSISLDNIEATYRHLASLYDVMLVEGAGGLLAPLTGELRMLDLACALGLPVLVVARNVLGAINHITLTVRATQAAGLPVVGVVLNNPQPFSDAATQTNSTSVKRWGEAPFLGEMPYLPSLSFEALRQAAEVQLAKVLCFGD